MPTWIKIDISRNMNSGGPFPKDLQAVERMLHFVSGSNDAYKVLHHPLKIILYLERILATRSFKGGNRSCCLIFDLGIVDRSVSILFGKLRRILSRSFAEHDQIGQ